MDIAIERYRDVVSYNAMLDVFVKAGEFSRARQLFDEMPARDSVSWGTVLVGVRLSSYFLTVLVDLYAKCGCIETVLEIFEASPDKNVFTWNAMFVGLAMHGHGKLSLNYFCRMIEAGVKPDGMLVSWGTSL
ncbi:hypothetical protein ACE6H2_006674 [Prunus campanulata]